MQKGKLLASLFVLTSLLCMPAISVKYPEFTVHQQASIAQYTNFNVAKMDTVLKCLRIKYFLEIKISEIPNHENQKYQKAKIAKMEAEKDKLCNGVSDDDLRKAENGLKKQYTSKNAFFKKIESGPIKKSTEGIKKRVKYF